MSGTTAIPTGQNNIDSVQVSLPQMLDLALGTSEIGVVNFNILHNFLYVLLNRSNLGNTKVEYRGENAIRINQAINSLHPNPCLIMQEFNMIDELGVVKKESDSEIDEYEGFDAPQNVVLLEPIVNGSYPTMNTLRETLETVRELQRKFYALDELTKNSEIIERLKGRGSEALSDVWHTISINKRLDATEQGIEKLTSMLQDVIKGNIEIARRTDYEDMDFHYPSEADERLDFIEHNLLSLEQAVSNLESIIGFKPVMKDENERNINDALKAQDFMDAVVKEEEEQDSNVSKFRPSIARHSIPESIDLVGINDNVITLKQDVSNMKQRIDNLNQKIDSILSEANEPSEVHPREHSPVSGRQNDQDTDLVDEKSSKTVPEHESQEISEEKSSKPPPGHKSQEINHEKSSKVPSGHQMQEINHEKSSKVPSGHRMQEINEDDEKMNELEQGVSKVMDRLSIQLDGDPNDNGPTPLNNNAPNLQNDLNKLASTIEKMSNDNGNRDMRYDALVEQMDLIKITKADKGDIEDALADKADLQIVDQKVSQDQFDAYCQDLKDALENVNVKLDEQETTWQQIMNDVQNELENKTNKFEILPFKDFVNDQLKLIQDEIKVIVDAQNDMEAAGGRKLLRIIATLGLLFLTPQEGGLSAKLIIASPIDRITLGRMENIKSFPSNRDLQCISCDRNVVMRMEQNVNAHAESFPYTMSIRPYLTYELDQVRNQQKKLHTSRNMIQFEAAIREDKNKSRKNNDTTKNHLCNRYCGGSHTILSPQQKVMRSSHFTSEWPTVQSNEKWIQGEDGKLYRGRDKAINKYNGCYKTNNQKLDQESVGGQANDDQKRLSKVEN